MTAPDRAAVIAAMRDALGIAEAIPGLPLPYMREDLIVWYLGGDSARMHLHQLDGAIGLDGGIDPVDRDRWVATGTLHGMPVRVSVKAADVAEYKVTGMTELREWTLKEIAQDAAETAESEAEK